MAKESGIIKQQKGAVLQPYPFCVHLSEIILLSENLPRRELNTETQAKIEPQNKLKRQYIAKFEEKLAEIPTVKDEKNERKLLKRLLTVEKLDKAPVS